jgi:hypothetical protein
MKRSVHKKQVVNLETGEIKSLKLIRRNIKMMIIAVGSRERKIKRKVWQPKNKINKLEIQPLEKKTKPFKFKTHYYEKLIIAGDLVRWKRFELPVISGGSKISNTGRGSDRMLSEEEKTVNREKTMKAAETNIVNLMNVNLDEMTKFFTVTFRENITDLDRAHYEFGNFIERLRNFINKYQKGKPLKYIGAIEFQKRGAIHFHVMANFDYIKHIHLLALWKGKDITYSKKHAKMSISEVERCPDNGSICINNLNAVDSRPAYLIKYVNKANKDERLRGRKCFVRSNNLKSPRQVVNEKEIATFKENVLKHETPIENYSYENDYLGFSEVKTYLLNQKAGKRGQVDKTYLTDKSVKDDL